MAQLTYGDKVCVYDVHGVLLGRGDIRGRNSYDFTHPTQYLVMPEGKKSLKDSWGFVPASRVRKAYDPVPDESSKHIDDLL